MIVGIDISQVVYQTGSSTYTKNLVKSLLKLEPEIRYKLFASSLRRLEDLDIFTNTLEGKFVVNKYRIPPSGLHFLWNKLHLTSIEKFVGDVDIFHSSDWTQPPSTCRKVTTIHDMSPILFPTFTHPRIVSIHAQRLTWVKKEVDAIIVPSEFTKNDVMNYGIEESRIHVVPEAVEISDFDVKKENIVNTLNKFKLKGRFLLAVGANKRKNIKRTIQAFRNIRKHEDLQLVVVGNPSGIDNLSMEDVLFLGHVTDSELSSLYQSAQALVYPSLYEGFGLPILEAFASNCPVVCSNLSSLPEVAGKAAVLVDPYSVYSIEKGISKILQNRQLYVKRGKSRLKMFSWEKTAQKTLEIYKRLYNTA